MSGGGGVNKKRLKKRQGKEVDDAAIAAHHKRVTWIATAEQAGCQARVPHKESVQSACHIPNTNPSDLCAPGIRLYQAP